MRRTTAALLTCLLLAALLAGCGPTQKEPQRGESYALYYQVRDLDDVRGGDVIGKENTTVAETATTNSRRLARTLMNRLLEGPKAKRLKRTIPAGTVLLDLEISKGRAAVNLSSAYGSLSGIDLSLADYCITMTLCQVPGVEMVSVTVRGQELAYRDVHSFAPSDILRSSKEDVVGTVTALLYFKDAQGTLTPEPRTMQLYEGDTQAESVLKALQQGPESRELAAVIPDGFSVHSIWMEDDDCFVNLSTSALKKMPKDADLALALHALSRSLRSLETVNSVQYLVDGKLLNTYGGASINGK